MSKRRFNKIKIVAKGKRNSDSLRSTRIKGNTIKIDPKSLGNKQRIYRFTWNNYKEDDATQLALTFLEMNAKKFVFQEEIGEKNKTPHLQGVVFFENQISFNVMKRINKAISYQRCDYPKQAIGYCLKEKTRKPNGKRWIHNVNPEDYEEKPVVPLISHKEMCEDMLKQTLAELEAEGVIRLNVNHLRNLWNSPFHGYGRNV